MKFSDMQYTRPNLDEAKQTLTGLIEAFETAKTPEEAVEAYRAIDTYVLHLDTMRSLVYARHTMDTTDAFYDAEEQYFNDVLPHLEELTQRVGTALLESPHRAALTPVLGALLFDNIEISQKTFRPEIVPDLQEENRLTAEYKKLLASAKIEFDGKTLTLPQLEPYQLDPDRATRRAATEARAAWFLSHSAEFDDLFDKLVKVRTKMARALGYESFTELGYYRMQRNCYNQDMVETFRNGVREHLVPVTTRLKAEQAARINVPSIAPYDDGFRFPDGNATPTGTPDEMLDHARTMYHDLSPETGEFIDALLDNELIDVLTRPGKAVGGYCTALHDFKAAFIFANFNGTSGDVDVLTHEAGHAYAAHRARDIFPGGLRQGSYETCEVHSMSMEFFTWPWMENFFGAQTAKYRYAHLSDSIVFIPYGTMVDEFQHHIYANPDMTPAERNALWLKLEGIYRPYLDQKDVPFYGAGRRWQAQSHIYERPFYYIDYCLAQSVALSFWAADQENHAAAWEKYQTFVSYAGTKTFVDLIDAVGLPSPFAPGTLKTVADAAVMWLDGQSKLG